MITPDDVRRAVHTIDTSGIVDILENGVERSPRGRKPAVDHLRLLLIGMFLAIRHEGTATIQDIHDLLTLRLPLDIQADLGIRRRHGNKVTTVTLKNLYYQSSRLMKGLSYGESTYDIDDEERERRHRAVIDASNSLMDVFDLGWESTCYALDATGIWSWAKGGRKNRPVVDIDPDDDLTDDEIAALKAAAETGTVPSQFGAEPEQAKKRKPGTKQADPAGEPDTSAAGSELAEIQLGAGASSDPDAAWGMKTSKSGKREVFFGYHEHTLVQAPDSDHDKDHEPRLIRRLELTPASSDVVDVSLRLVDSLANGVRDLIVDLHYSYKRFDRWLAPLTERGVRQHHDLRTNEQGFTEYDQMRFAAGWAHCPATPDHLGTIPSLPPNAAAAEIEAFNEQIDQRRVFALRRVNQPDETGATRYQCPALAGTVGCPRRAGTVVSALALGAPIVENPPTGAIEGLPRCCTQATVKVTPPAKIRKLSQVQYWGSQAWQRLYRKRTYVEGSYGNRKNPSTENMRRGLFRSTGLVWANLVISMCAASHNERILRNWHDRTGRGDPTHPLLQPDTENHGFMFLTAEEAAAINEQRFGTAADVAA